MPGVRLKGLKKVSKRLADGRRATYWYAWVGGPRLPGSPGSPAFMAAYAAALAAHKATPRNEGTLAGLVARYRASPEFARLAGSTQREWRRWLARIEAAAIGTLPLAALEDRDVRPHLIAWRNGYADRPRSADYAAQVLARLLAWARGQGLIAVSHFEHVERLHAADRADTIWTDADLAAFEAAADARVDQALKLACFTGLRRGDLVALAWGQVGDTAIVLKTSKTGREALIPLLPEAQAVLRAIGRKGPEVKVLLNSHRRPWTVGSLGHRIVHFRVKAGLKGLRLHDARGTFATRLRLADLTRDQIAQVMGWEPDRVERILARYVDQGRIVRAIADKLAANAERTKTGN